jgi:hypothetical protein
MHIPATTIAALKNALQSVSDAGLSDDTPLYMLNGDNNIVPLLSSDDEESDRPLAVGHLRDLFAPFAAWGA